MYSDIVLRTDIDHLVVKRNELVHSHGYLSEVENNIILLAIILTRLYAKDEERDIQLDSVIRISANDYIQIFNVTRSNAYNCLNTAVNSLYERSFSIKENGIQVDHRWLVSKASKQATSVADGFIEFAFTKKALQMIVDFDHTEGKYTAYGIERVSRLKGRFSGKIYELAMESKFKDIKQTKVFEFEELRNILGVPKEQYRDTRGWDKIIAKENLPTRFDNFRKEVLDKSIEMISAESDITIKYHTYKKTGRIFGVAFSFNFKANYVPKFAQEELFTETQYKAGTVTVGDETTKKVSAAKKQSKPKTESNTNEDNSNENPLASTYQKPKVVEFDPYKPSNQAYESYLVVGGSLTITEMENKCRLEDITASRFILAECTRLKKQTN